MPLVTIKGIEGVFSSEQKAKIIEAITDTMVSVEGEKMRPVTWVLFEEVKSGDWGIGGKAITADQVKKIQSGEADSL
ncbi:4-oxalocrotonate tautomerase family protein [Pseudomonas sichuanensis]|uniref:tautomerase family protein n=1 Tax=Pseudomonas sichuanensis TaxID=2213015 RepID=UPI00215E07E3|nr:4-oxalocrotonate tautomerase family protein [Pseudomonas sichuanensis]MDH0729242.1 4-oxalocrotonate tautomerase family protein [Pseudomonas sichuanensis]MDH1581798.1 4-oxalocrotonate tautomerase family protein [Pseudomonas sichuanensis]MDH1592087.1 4-oxalocrotonate tautomerase family protein [Pseudomonas sichuanensis]MDH1597653.1 4-oxalocrotonate tautomerase family protein [Pseudomonas sichuanensis]UVK84840.1 4-oxalocrotonate tautomerase family protein [Pseudomonas sichuanensis]